MKDKSLNKTTDETREETTTPKTSVTAESADQEASAAHLIPFAKPYNVYFEAIREADRALRQRAAAIYETYLKAARAAMEAQDSKALRQAAEEFSDAWAELTKPENIASSVSSAYDAYFKEVRSALASGAADLLGPGCFALVARSMAVVASHRMAFHNA